MLKKNSSFEKKEDLINAALEEFSNNSYKEASLNNIINKAGISKGTFYYHFENKESLYLFLLNMIKEEKIKYIILKTKENKTSDSINNILDYLKQQAKFGISFAVEFPKYQKLGKMYLQEKGNHIYDKAKENLSNNSDEFFSKFVKQAFDSNFIRNDIPIEHITNYIKFIFINFDEMINYENYIDKLDLLNEIMENYFKIIEEGIKK